MESIPTKFEDQFDAEEFLDDIQARGLSFEDLPGRMFAGLVVYFDDSQDLECVIAANILRLSDGIITAALEDTHTTHIVIAQDQLRLREVRKTIKRFGSRPSFLRNFSFQAHLDSRSRIPHLVTLDWVQQSWAERTLLDEEREYSIAPVARGARLSLGIY